MSCSNCSFLTCIQISQEAGQVVWYSHLFKNFPQFVVIHRVKGFGIVNKAEVDVSLELSCFSMIQWMLTIWSLFPLPFLNPAWTSGSSQFTYCWSLVWHKSCWRRLPLAPFRRWADNPQIGEQLHQRSCHTVVKVLGPTVDFPTWGSGKKTENAGEFDFEDQYDLTTELAQDWGNRLLEGTNKTLCTPGPRRKE